MGFTPRYRYRAITDRPAAAWPGERPLAVMVALNIEAYAYGEGLAEDLVPDMPQPDVLNSSWRDYGLRVGAWRLLDLFAELDIPATILLNSNVCAAAPDLLARIVADGHEIAGHGRTNSESNAGLDEAAETELIEEVASTIAQASGARPQGWLSPWLAETPATPDRLAAAGYSYVMDFCCDDQPIWLQTQGAPLLSVPYSQEINDSAAIIGRQAGAAEFADMIVDQVDEMLAQPQPAPLVFGLALHGNIAGQPFRLRQLRRALSYIAGKREQIWLTRGRDIAEIAYAHPDRFV